MYVFETNQNYCVYWLVCMLYIHVMLCCQLFLYLSCSGIIVVAMVCCLCTFFLLLSHIYVCVVGLSAHWVTMLCYGVIICSYNK
jgi:hypothetical protein